MKNTIAVFAIIAVAAVSIGVTGVSANSLMTASVPTMTSNNMLTGHLEYTLLDESGNVKAYGQTDNFITTAGDRCIAELVFEPGSGDTSNASCVDQAFGVIGISNNTVTSEDNINMGDEQAGVNQVGIMATVNATSINLGDPDVTNATPNAAVTAVLSNSAHPFVFENESTTVTNVTSGSPEVEIAYLLQSNCAGMEVDGTCNVVPGGEILASQTLSNLAISDGDSLTITWTVTIGANDS